MVMGLVATVWIQNSSVSNTAISGGRLRGGGGSAAPGAQAQVVRVASPNPARPLPRKVPSAAVAVAPTQQVSSR